MGETLLSDGIRCISRRIRSTKENKIKTNRERVRSFHRTHVSILESIAKREMSEREKKIEDKT